jgi:hypothetical protein
MGKIQLKVVKVADARLERLRDDYRPKKYTPATLEIADFPPLSRDTDNRAGIVELLAPARNMDVLLIVLRAFDNPTVPVDGGSIDPWRDWESIRSELLLSDLVIVEKRLEKLQAQVKKFTPTQEQDKRELALLERVQQHLEAERDLSEFVFSGAERKQIQGFQFLSLKPKVVVLNRDERPLAAELVDRFTRSAGARPYDLMAKNELEILQLPPEDQEGFRKELGVQEGTREAVIQQCYERAGLISFFTAGEKEVRAWTIARGESAVEAAGKIHSDIQRGFIRAEVVGFRDYERDGGIKGAKEKGRFRLEGKEYTVQDGDIIEFRFSI